MDRLLSLPSVYMEVRPKDRVPLIRSALQARVVAFRSLIQKSRILFR